MRALGALLLALLALAAAIGFVALCVRVAGGPDAWKVALLLVATVPWLAAFATRERR